VLGLARLSSKATSALPGYSFVALFFRLCCRAADDIVHAARSQSATHPPSDHKASAPGPNE
jgi:hypothetical protein